MDEMTPLVNGMSEDLTQCDGIEITTNLFKDHKMSIQEKTEKLNTYLRIRALNVNNNNNNEPNNKSNCYQIIDSKTLLVNPPKGSNANKFGSDSIERKKFTFSQIFNEKVNQLSIYENCAHPLVKRFLSGENGLLFAYGITSSGKSYTMRGNASNPGVIPRALNTIFETIGHQIVKEVPNLKPNRFSECVKLFQRDQEIEEHLRKFIFETVDRTSNSSLHTFRSQISLISDNTSTESQWKHVLSSTFQTDVSKVRFSVWITFYDIYNENIYDLLDVEISGEKKSSILLLRDEFQNYYVKGLRQICVSSAEEAYKVFLFGQNKLSEHISFTDLNKESSRSHCVFNISLVTMNTSNGIPNTNNLSFCDLAGAERSEKANNTGERIREAGKINGSLLSLSRCLSTIRHNQKFENDKSKQRFVNFRDSKLTKVLQPFLSGNGIASMIANLNPSPNLFDETIFALNFTGVASQIVVSTEEQRNKFQDSLKRLTQVWMQSSERWSNFAHINPPKPSISIIHCETIQEEEDNESDTVGLDITYEELEKKVNEISRMDLTQADPQEMEVLRAQIDFLAEKLKETESAKFEMELEVRRQVVSEFNKLIKDMEEMAEDKDRSKKRLEEMMSERIKNAERIHNEDRKKLEKRINDMENELFKDKEELCKESERNKQLTEENNRLKESQQSLKDEIDVLKESLLNKENQIEENSVLKESQQSLKSEIDFLKAILVEKENQIINLSTQLNERNDTIVSKDAEQKEFRDIETSVTNLIEFDSIRIDCEEKGIGTSFVEHIDIETTTQGLNEKCDKNTSFSVSYENRSTFIESKHLNLYEDKQTLTECLSPIVIPIKVDQSVETNQLIATEVSTSPLVVNKTDNSTSPLTNLTDDRYVSKEDFENLRSKYETELRVKEEIIAFNRELVDKRDQELKKLREEKNNYREPNNLEFLKHCKSFKPNSMASSVSSVNSLSVRSDDTISVTSAASLALKEKQNIKSAKYSSRKKKVNLNNSMEKRYLYTVGENKDNNSELLSQSSVNSDMAESTQDEIGNVAYSVTKKRPDRKSNKRKGDNSFQNNEDFNKVTESKRKRPPIKNLSISPISPIPTEEVKKIVTRSRAKRAIKF